MVEEQFINEVKVMLEKVQRGYMHDRFDKPIHSKTLEELRIKLNEMLEALESNVCGRYKSTSSCIRRFRKTRLYKKNLK